MYLLQELVVLLHQLIVALRLGLLQLQTETNRATTHTLTTEFQHHKNKNNPSASNSCVLTVGKLEERVGVEADSPPSAHPFYVLDDFIDVGLIDLDLLPEHKQSGRVSLDEILKKK